MLAVLSIHGMLGVLQEMILLIIHDGSNKKLYFHVEI